MLSLSLSLSTDRADHWTAPVCSAGAQGGPQRSRPVEGKPRNEGASEAAPGAVRQAVGGSCQSGWGRLLSVTNAIEVGTWCSGDSGWA